jgi:hypothetical protein
VLTGQRLGDQPRANRAETLELGAQEHIDKVREFLGADKYEAIDVPGAET